MKAFIVGFLGTLAVAGALFAGTRATSSRPSTPTIEYRIPTSVLKY